MPLSLPGLPWIALALVVAAGTVPASQERTPPVTMLTWKDRFSPGATRVSFEALCDAAAGQRYCQRPLADDIPGIHFTGAEIVDPLDRAGAGWAVTSGTAALFTRSTHVAFDEPVAEVGAQISIPAPTDVAAEAAMDWIVYLIAFDREGESLGAVYAHVPVEGNRAQIPARPVRLALRAAQPIAAVRFASHPPGVAGDGPRFVIDDLTYLPVAGPGPRPTVFDPWPGRETKPRQDTLRAQPELSRWFTARPWS